MVGKFRFFRLLRTTPATSEGFRRTPFEERPVDMRAPVTETSTADPVAQWVLSADGEKEGVV